MSCPEESDQAVVERTRRLLAKTREKRWGLLLLALIFLGFSLYTTALGIRKIEALDELSSGFLFGLGLAVVWTTLGIIGAFFLAKFLAGVDVDCRAGELLVRYHDRLRDLGQLPQEGKGETKLGTDGGQPESRS